MEITIKKTSGVDLTEVPDDVASDLQDVYDALKELPVNQLAETPEFADVKAARLFVRQGKAWASRQQVAGPDGELNTLVFSRRGEVKANPKVVQFRIYRPATDKEKATAKVAAD